MKRMELLAPAGNMEKLKISFLYGADAAYLVYQVNRLTGLLHDLEGRLAGTSFSLRAFSDNFTPEEMKEAVDYAHSLGKKIYVTVNIFPSGKDYKELPGYLRYLEKIKADAVLIADPGIFRLCREVRLCRFMCRHRRILRTGRPCSFGKNAVPNGLSWPGRCRWPMRRKSAPT